MTKRRSSTWRACFLRDTAYIQLGGPDETGRDVTTRLSYLVLEAAHRLRIPANVAVCVGDHVDPNLLRRGVEILFEDRTGIPKFLGIEKNGRRVCAQWILDRIGPPAAPMPAAIGLLCPAASIPSTTVSR